MHLERLFFEGHPDLRQSVFNDWRSGKARSERCGCRLSFKMIVG
jgi:hypothetical protein